MTWNNVSDADSVFKAMFTLDSFCWLHEKPSGTVWTLIQHVTLHFKDRRGAASLCYRNLT